MNYTVWHCQTQEANLEDSRWPQLAPESYMGQNTRGPAWAAGGLAASMAGIKGLIPSGSTHQVIIQQELRAAGAG